MPTNKKIEMASNFVKKEITPEVISTFIDGHDPMERIVNFDYKYQDDFITVYYRDENDRRLSVEEPYLPFLWATKNACLKMKAAVGNNELRSLMQSYGIWCKALDVTNTEGEVVEEILDGYTFMFYACKPMSYSKFLEFFRKAGNPVYADKKRTNNDNSFTNQPTAKRDERQYLVVTPVEQHMISTGKRMFKGYDDYDQTLRLIFDLETTGLNTKTDRIEQFGIRFNRPVMYKGKLMDFEKVYTTEGNTDEEKNASELKNIETFLKVIYTFKPDVITAHNGETFDWNMIIDACERLGKPMDVLSKPFFKNDIVCKNPRETILKLGGEIETYHQTKVPGTIITDSLHAVRRAQALDSNMLFSNLKYVTKYSKIVKHNRVYVPGDMISKVWNDEEHAYAFNDSDGDWYMIDPSYAPQIVTPDPTKDINYFANKIKEDSILRTVSGKTYESTIKDGATAESLYNDYLKSIEKENHDNLYKKGKSGDSFKLYTKNFLMDGYEVTSGRYIVQRYLLDDLWECDKVEHRYNTSNFLVCKMLPVPFQKCCTMGTAGQWKALMLAWSYENNLAIPPFGESKSFTGGLSRLLKVGFVDNVAKFDYNSLYPSIILTWGISDSKDLMHAMLYFLEHVLTQREKYKKLKKKAGKEAEKYKAAIENHEYSSEAELNELKDKLLKAKGEEMANDKKQLPLKIFGNSFFGSYGAPNVFPFASIPCAERTTCTGRQALRLMICSFTRLGYSPIVGDSFTEDTPLFVKYSNGLIDIVPIRSIIDNSKIEIDDLGREYDYSKKPYKVLCRSGWVEPSYIYRHKTDKDIYEVTDGDMKVEVTEDHSLFNSKKEKIKPSQINSDTVLEYYTSPITGEYNGEVSIERAKEWGRMLAEGDMICVPIMMLNCFDKVSIKAFYEEFMKHYREDMVYSKTCLAGIQYLKATIG